MEWLLERVRNLISLDSAKAFIARFQSANCWRASDCGGCAYQPGFVDVQGGEGVEILVISASGRMDTPAVYAKWPMNRIQAGYFAVPNPFNRKQASKYRLR